MKNSKIMTMALLMTSILFIFISNGYGQVKIGAIQDMSGPTAGPGLPHSQGVADYIQYINENGGLNGEKVELIMVDYKYQIPLALQNYQKMLTQDKVVAILGWGTGDSEILAPKTTADNMVFIPASFAESVHLPLKPYVFNIASTYTDEFVLLIKYAKQIWKQNRKPKIAFCHVDVPFGREPIEKGKKSADQFGAELVDVVSYPANMLSAATTVIPKLMAANPDFVIIQDTVERAAIVVRDAKAAGMANTQFMGTYYTADSSFIKITGDAAAEGFIGIGPFCLWEDNSAPGSAVIKDFTKKYHPDITNRSKFYIQGWVAAMTLCEAIKKAGKAPTSLGIKNALETLKDFNTGGWTGPLTFTPTKHGGTAFLKLFKVKSGKFVNISDWLSE